MTEETDIYTRVTGKIITMLETANAKGWKQPWLSNGRDIMQPRNALTKAAYRGINVLSLWGAAQAEGYSESVYATYRQWGELGCQVKKAEKGNLIVFWKLFDRETEDAEPDADGKKHGGAFAKASWVFAAEQVTGYAPPPRPPLPSVAERIEATEAYIANTGIRIEHGGNAAFYRPADRRVKPLRVPRATIPPPRTSLAMRPAQSIA